MSGHGTLSTDDLSHQAERLSLAPDVHPDSLRSKDDPRPSQQLSEYRYEPLDSDSNIRILILQPALDISSPLITNLVQVRRRYNSGDRPLPILQDYVAISYHWGPPHFVCAITCDGRSLAVTPNVDHMLRRLRKVDRPRGLWIDAICLYQANKVEKSVQIQQMRQIYEEAKKVIIWLGEPSAFVGDLKAHQSLADLEAEATGTALNVIASLRYLKATGEVPDDRMGRSLDQFLQNPWFKRRWIIQEATAHGHTTIFYGDQKIAWPELAFCVDRLRMDHGVSSTKHAIDRIRRMKNPPSDIFDAIYTYQDFECGDVRDIIAALRGLAVLKPEDKLQLWEVDYQDSWAQNFISFAEAVIFAGHSAKIYDHLEKFGSLRGTVYEYMPCWVPNWTSNGAWACAWRPDGRAISLDQSFDVKRAVRLHLFSSIDKRLPGLSAPSTSTKFGDNDLANALGGTWDMIDLPERIYKLPEESSNPFAAIETLFRSLADDLLYTRITLQDLQSLLMECLPMREIAREYLHQTSDDEQALRQFRNVISVWLTAMSSGHRSKTSEVGCQQRWRTIKLARSSQYCPLNLPYKLTSQDYELDLLDWGIINDCLYVALQQLLRHHVFFLAHEFVGIVSRTVSPKRRFLTTEPSVTSKPSIWRGFERVIYIPGGRSAGYIEDTRRVQFDNVQAMIVRRN